MNLRHWTTKCGSEGTRRQLTSQIWQDHLWSWETRKWCEHWSCVLGWLCQMESWKPMFSSRTTVRDFVRQETLASVPTLRWILPPTLVKMLTTNKSNTISKGIRWRRLMFLATTACVCQPPVPSNYPALALALPPHQATDRPVDVPLSGEEIDHCILSLAI